MTYDIFITAAAENDLSEAADYIEYVLKNPDAANHLITTVVERISRLTQFAEQNALASDPFLRTWGIRFIQIGNYLAFYTISEEHCRIDIIRFIYSKRDWISILKDDLLFR